VPWREACKAFHHALNRCAGEVVFEHGLARFVAAQPAFEPLRDDWRASCNGRATSSLAMPRSHAATPLGWSRCAGVAVTPNGAFAVTGARAADAV
jgi:hypothetical protein